MTSNYLKSERSRQLIDNLRELRLDKYIELPQIAVMGDTSSGKSSVLSALSGINFPSSSELTTKCPTQLKLSNSPQFHGTVFLQRFEKRNGEEVKMRQLETIEAVTDAIEKLTKQLVAEGQSISDDSIVIELRGPTFMNLTLTDLPGRFIILSFYYLGIIRTVKDKEDKSIIPKVRALVKRYLKQEQTIILAVIQASVDVHNSEILQAAEEVDPLGLRTIGIITKPDLIDGGAERGVIDLLHNKMKHLKLGYHVVKCRGQHDLNTQVSIERGVKDEAVFFGTHDSWSSVESNFKGIKTLGPKLVSLLERQIEKALPIVIKEVDNQIRECSESIKKFGVAMDSSASRRLYFSKVCNTYTSILNAAQKGNYIAYYEFFTNEEKDNRMRSLFKRRELDFQKTVEKTSYECKELMKVKPEFGQCVLCKSKADWQTVVVVNIKETKGEFEITHMANGSQTSFTKEWKHIASKNLEDLKDRIEKNRGDQLTIFPSYQIFSSIVGEHINEWREPTITLFDEVVKIIESVYSQAIVYLHTSPSLQTNVSSVTIDALTRIKDECRIVLEDALQHELRPYTLDQVLTEILEKKRNEPIIKSLKELSNQDNVSLRAVISILKSYGIGEASNEDKEAIEMEMSINAYLEVAKKRVVDKIPMLIQQNLVEPFIREIEDSLNLDDVKLEQILSDSPQVINERKQLFDQQDALKKSKVLIMNL